jgi:hypothetical protein
MGNRSVITVVSSEATVSLYGHWAGETNLEAVRNVLSRTDRIGNHDYLTAQLFHEFAVNLGNYDGTLGYGITAGEYESDWLDNPTVIVNAETGEYCLEGEETITEFAKPYPAMGRSAI